MHAADYAVLMSNKYDAELYALHVVHPADADVISEPTQASSYSVENTNQEAQKYLDKVKLKANENNIQLKTEVISSVNAAGGIVDYAEPKMSILLLLEQGENRVSGNCCLEALHQTLRPMRIVLYW